MKSSCIPDLLYRDDFITTTHTGVKPSKGLRVALYSHDTMGLGHIRRNLLIAQVLSVRQVASAILVITGTRLASSFTMSQGVDYLVLPSLYKELNGEYRSRNLSISLSDLIELRKKTLYASISAFEPDVLIVDNVPLGVSGELETILDYLYSQGKTKCVLGLRDVLDDADTVKKEWYLRRNYHAIRKYYKEIWVYGDAHVYDLAQEYEYSSDIAAKVRYIGYLDQRIRLENGYHENNDKYDKGIKLPRVPYVLCMVGGGQDGAGLARAFADAELPLGMQGVLLLGPYMDARMRQHFHERALNNPQLLIFDFISEPTALLHYAECVISMGGYNTVLEILSFEKRALVVPRVVPRKEQLIRAQRLKELCLLDMLCPDQVNPQTLTKWILDNIGLPPLKLRHRIDMNGLERLPQLLKYLVNTLSCHKQKNTL